MEWDSQEQQILEVHKAHRAQQKRSEYPDRHPSPRAQSKPQSKTMQIALLETSPRPVKLDAQHLSSDLHMHAVWDVELNFKDNRLK